MGRADRERNAAPLAARPHRHDDRHAAIGALDRLLHVDVPVLPRRLHVVEVLLDSGVAEVAASGEAEHRLELDLGVADGDGGGTVT